LIGGLPTDFDASIFVVWHMAPDIKTVLPDLINRGKTLPAGNAVDGELIQSGRVYIAPPDHHLLLDQDRVRVTRGPKENRFRPAIDPLFRSAAVNFGPGVIGIILSGALDDGSSGLWCVKQNGGIAIVQDPADAEVPSMPEAAIRNVQADYILPVSEIAPLLEQLCSEKIEFTNTDTGISGQNKLTADEIQIALQQDIPAGGIRFGELTPFTCPECHGVLAEINEGEFSRYRCHTGHAFTTAALLVNLNENIEINLWNTIRSLEESVVLLNNTGDHYAEVNRPHLAAIYFQKASEAASRCQVARMLLLTEKPATGTISDTILE
jgi:two-component system, chemotaxis family, protein-glutamate methylesterase/glutaminase